MLESTVELIGEALTSVLIRLPGAFIRWIVFGKMDFNEYFEDDWESNSVPVIMVLVPLLIVVTSFRSTYYI
ncbi:MAG: hypothetical protein K0S33_2692 [Bacteroidetes bacterium]|jgi:hypothetical protein|nr:hypothetical protein [Bacteroidota bacterium]